MPSCCCLLVAECQASRAECVRMGTVVKRLQTQVCCLEEELAQSKESSQACVCVLCVCVCFVCVCVCVCVSENSLY